MQIDYQLTDKDFTETFAAHRNRSLFGKWLRRLVLLFILGLAVISTLSLVAKPTMEQAKALVPFLLLTLLWAVILWLFPTWGARRQFLKQPGAQGPRSVMLNASGTRWRWNGGSSEIEWKNYIRVVEAKNQFLLYSSPACFNIIPKRALAQGQLPELQRLLEQNVPKH